MKNLILFLLLTFVSANALACQKYITIGVGYKIQEADRATLNSGQIGEADFGRKETARIEAGCEVKNWTFGVSHDSQWFSGAPLNDDPEYHKTEVFVDYTWRF
jgi:hypothetical protein